MKGSFPNLAAGFPQFKINKISSVSRNSQKFTINNRFRHTHPPGFQILELLVTEYKICEKEIVARSFPEQMKDKNP